MAEALLDPSDTLSRAAAPSPVPARATAPAEAHAPSVLYEYPLNERVRTLLRLESLFERLALFSARDHAADHHAALLTLFEILEVSARADLKSDLLQEMERQRQALLALRDEPAVAGEALEAVLRQLDECRQRLNGVAGKSGQHLRDNDWLMSIRGRVGIPGGACEFDLPSYHAWQHRPAALRRADLAGWTAPFAPLLDGLSLVLRLLRESGQRSTQTTRQGSHQQAFGGRAYQLLQIRVPEGIAAVPEISANRYMVWIRFSGACHEQRARPHEGEVGFELTLCNF